jgi:hypothetical protein
MEQTKNTHPPRREEPCHFPLGSVFITPAANARLDSYDVALAVTRHSQGDWGELDSDDWEANDLSLHEGLRLLSVYHDRRGTTFWVITEADRSATTVLLPEDY